MLTVLGVDAVHALCRVSVLRFCCLDCAVLGIDAVYVFCRVTALCFYRVDC